MGKLIQMEVIENLQEIPQRVGVISKIPINKNWQIETIAGNNAMNKALYFTAYDHYKISLNIAKNIFKAHQYYEKVPDNLVPAIVVSYLNICDLWSKQHKTTARKGYLCAAFDYLVIQLRTPNLCDGLQEQIRSGLDKVFAEITETGDIEISAIKKKILMTL